VIEQLRTVKKLEEQVWAMLQDQHLAVRATGSYKFDSSPLHDYEVITQDPKIPRGVQYLALHCIAEKQRLYTDAREPSEMLGVISEEIDKVPLVEALQAIRHLKISYSQVYQMNPALFDRAEENTKVLVDRLPLEKQTQLISQVKDSNLNATPLVEQVESSTKLRPRSNNSYFVSLWLISSIILIAGIGLIISFIMPMISKTNPINNPPTLPEKFNNPNQSPPENLVDQYYREISAGEYRSAWNKLPFSLRNDPKAYPKGYKSFVDFFEKLRGIEVESLTVITRSETQASLNADVKCLQGNGSTLPLFVKFSLGRSSKSQEWQIYKIEQNPFRKSLCGISN
jgi:hypothetical protein